MFDTREPFTFTEYGNDTPPELSVVVPMYNEEDNAAPLCEALQAALKDIDYEVIFVDDGSSDRTVQNLTRAADSRCFILELTRNFGQTAAMAAGIARARGALIATMDGDLQNDPADIPLMLAELRKGGYDIVVGNRAKRKDNLLHRKLPSRIANFLIRKITKVEMTDQGCSLKVFKADVAKRLELYGELHRFIAILAHLDGAKIKEMPVRHHARQFGASKYGLGRIFRVISDMMLLYFLMRFLRRPMHLFGALGTALLCAGGAIETYLLALKIMGHDIGDRPLFFVGIFLLISGLQLITTGFIAELLMRTYYGSGRSRLPYHVKAEHAGEKPA